MLNKKEKQEIIEKIAERLGNNRIVIFTDFTGLNVEQLQVLRNALKAEKMIYQVAKKSLINLAFKKKGLDIDIEQFAGSLALAFGNDEIKLTKLIYDFSQTNEALQILGGLLENKFLSQEELNKIALLPTKEELLAKMIRCLNSPLYNLISDLKNNITKLLFVLESIKNKNDNAEANSKTA